MSTHGPGENTLQCQAWLARADVQESFLAAIPLFHVFSMVAVMSFAVSLHAAMIMVPNARAIADVVECIHTYRPTIFMGVPALFNAINNHPAVAAGKYDLSSIYACISGSAPLPPATKRRFEELSGGVIIEGFGMSEAPTASHANPVRGENRTGSIGLPFPDMAMRIVDLDEGVDEVPVGEVGELVMRGPQLMKGYYGMPTETANALREGPDGEKWLYTGDIARMDETAISTSWIGKDIALIGFNVYPRIVEDTLMDILPCWRQAWLRPHPGPARWGGSTEGVGRRQARRSVTARDLTDFCAQKLAV